MVASRDFQVGTRHSWFKPLILIEPDPLQCQTLGRNAIPENRATRKHRSTEQNEQP